MKEIGCEARSTFTCVERSNPSAEGTVDVSITINLCEV